LSELVCADVGFACLKHPTIQLEILSSFRVMCATIRYDIYLLQLGFHPLALVLTLVHKRQRRVTYIRRNNRDHGTHNTLFIYYCYKLVIQGRDLL